MRGFKKASAVVLSAIALSSGIAASTSSASAAPLSSSAPGGSINYGKNGNKVVEAGDAISIPKPGAVMSCTLGPIITPHVAITANHCANPGDKIIVDGKVVGRAVTPIIGRDVVVVALNGALPTKMTRTSVITPRVGEKVSMRGTTSGIVHGTVSSGVQKIIIDKHGVFNKSSTPAYLAKMTVRKGDSGSAVYNSRGEAVGIVSGFTSDGQAGIVPIIK